VWLSFDDDVRAPRETLRALVDAAHETGAIVMSPCISREGKSVNIKIQGAWDKALIRTTSQGEKLYPLVLGCFSLVAIPRRAVETLCRHALWVTDDADGKSKTYPVLFLETVHEGRLVGEDVNFYLRALDAGIDVFALLEHPVTHAGRACLVRTDGTFQTDEASAKAFAKSEAPTAQERQSTLLPPSEKTG
jgi:hypothetical protein